MVALIKTPIIVIIVNHLYFEFVCGVRDFVYVYSDCLTCVPTTTRFISDGITLNINRVFKYLLPSPIRMLMNLITNYCE